jgi:hypothetical protein
MKINKSSRPPIMKLRAFSFSMLAAMLVHPSVANEPTASNTTAPNKVRSGTTVTVTRTMTPARRRYVRKRIVVLKEQVREYEKAQNVADTMDFMSGRFTSPSREAQQRYLKNRFEYLALKAELGKATPADLNELRRLQHTLLGR